MRRFLNTSCERLEFGVSRRALHEMSRCRRLGAESRKLMLKAEQFTTEEQYDTTEAILRIRRAHNRVWSSVAVALLMSVFLLPTLLFYYGLSTIGENDTKGPAPDADFATRREWGESELKHHFKRVDQWLRKADQITRDVGLVTGVAPIGGPNRFNSYFGESDASLNLQVIGKNGEGILCLPDVCADDPDYIYGLERGSTWTFNGRCSRLIVEDW